MNLKGKGECDFGVANWKEVGREGGLGLRRSEVVIEWSFGYASCGFQ